MRKLVLLTATLVISATLPAGISTAEADTPIGLRLGFTDDPDSLFVGVHGQFHPRKIRRLRVEPSFEVGFGDDIDFFTFRGNLNFKIMFPLNRDAAFYPLLGPSLYYVNFDGGGSDTEFGLNLGLGFSWSGFAFDLAFGLPDENLPDVTFTFSYTFW